MQITRIRVAGLHGATPEGGWTLEHATDDVIHTLVAIHTDDGIVGLGSCFSSESLVRAALEQLEPILIGADPREPEKLAQTMSANTFWMGRGGAIAHAISGVDIALWDIFGQITGQPIGRLLGGRYRERVQPYASMLAIEPSELRDQLLSLKEQNFHAFKIGWGGLGRKSAAHDELLVSTAREAIGPGGILAVDAGGSDAFWGPRRVWARRTADMLADYDVTWFEEALEPDDIQGFADLRRVSKVRISGGEVLTRRQDFMRFLDAGAFDVVQPDTTKGGGISESRRVGWYAEARGAKLIPHGWNTAIGLAADLQLASALAQTDLVEYITGSSYIDELLEVPFTLDSEGYIDIPNEPGLGVRLSPDALERFASTDLLEGA